MVRGGIWGRVSFGIGFGRLSVGDREESFLM